MEKCQQKECVYFTLCTADHCEKSTRDALECLRSGKFYTTAQTAPASDPVSHPSHYTSHPSGVECITIAKHENFCIGNALKYLWRAGRKDPNKTIEDLKKAAQYIQYEIDRITEEQSK